MAMKWICTKCGEKAQDGVPEYEKNSAKNWKSVKPIDYHGICPLCGGPLKPIKKK